MDDQEAALRSFVGITSADREQAHELLEATNYNLEQAVDLFYNPSFPEFGQTDERYAQRLAQEYEGGAGGGSNGVVPHGDDEVRAPIPAKLDRLLGDVDYYSTRLRSNAAAQPHELSAFRDFEAEGSGLRGERAAAKNSLAGMFEPPRDLMFEGDFEHAKAEAEKRSLWLLVNIQSNTEFASHQLNRDTWGDEAVQSIIKGSFLFWQAYNLSSEGGKVVAYYKLYELPAILVIDPITGGVVRTFTGFMQSERLVEELVPFMDHTIHDPEAHRISSAHQKRKLSAPQAGPSRPPKDMNEDEELELALAMSMAAEEAAPPSKRSADASSTSGNDLPGSKADDESLRDAAPASTSGMAQIIPQAAPQKSPEELQAEAAASLPPEPETSSLSCRVAVRLPDGQRVTHRFLKTSPLSLLRTFCLASSPEAAAGRQFVFVQPRPGAPALGDMSQSLQEAGVVDAVINVVWS